MPALVELRVLVHDAKINVTKSDVLVNWSSSPVR
jgi:hypothetical protein